MLELSPSPLWQSLRLPTITDARGSVTFMEAGRHIPFPIERVYFLHSIGRGQQRAGHAHRSLQQVLVALNGSFDITCDDGRTKSRVRLDTPEDGLFLPPKVWINLSDFSPGAVCLVVCSGPHDPAEYVTDYHEFVARFAAAP